MGIDGFISNGGLAVVLIIAGCLFAVQAVICFLLWRKGDKSYFLKFLSYIIAAIPIIFLGIAMSIAINGPDNFAVMMIFVFVFATPVAIGIQIYSFIRNTWLSKEGEV